jgi:hypothetical protein
MMEVSIFVFMDNASFTILSGRENNRKLGSEIRKGMRQSD